MNWKSGWIKRVEIKYFTSIMESVGEMNEFRKSNDYDNTQQQQQPPTIAMKI